MMLLLAICVAYCVKLYIENNGRKEKAYNVQNSHHMKNQSKLNILIMFIRTSVYIIV